MYISLLALHVLYAAGRGIQELLKVIFTNRSKSVKEVYPGN